MMTAIAVLAILTLVGALLVGYLRSKNAIIESKDDKIDALEKAADAARKEEEAKDEKTAERLVRTGDRRGTIDFVRGSFKAGR